MKKEDLCIDGLYKIREKDLKRCAEVAAKAFFDDTSCKFIFASGLCYKALFDYYFVIYKAAYAKMYIFAESENIDGVIVITPVKYSEISVIDCIRQGALKIIGSQGLGILFRSLSYENNCIKMREKFAQKDSWYIFQFCVLPEKQGKKLGSKTIKPVLNWMDLNKINCCLETQKFVNVDIYSHFGFSLKMIGTLPDKEKKQFAMYRNYK